MGSSFGKNDRQTDLQTDRNTERQMKIQNSCTVSCQHTVYQRWGAHLVKMTDRKRKTDTKNGQKK